MAASYGIANYLGMFFAYFGFYFLICAIFIYVGYRWRKQGRSAKRRNALLIGIVMLSVVFMVLLVKLFAPVFNHVGDLLLPGGYEVRKTAGTVEYVMSEDHASLYFYDGRFYGGAYLYLDGQYYYVISDGSLQKDMLIELEYAHSSHDDVVLCWQEVTLTRAEHVLIEQEQQEVERVTELIKSRTEKSESTEATANMQELGTWLWRIGFAGFFCMVLLQTIGRWITRPYSWNVRKDGRIVYNRVIGLLWLVAVGFLYMIVLGEVLRSGATGLLFVLGMSSVPMLTAFLYDRTLSLEIDGQFVTISRFGREIQYRASDIRSVQWKSGWDLYRYAADQSPSERYLYANMQIRITDTRHSLVVICNDGKRYRFPVDTHLGVWSAYTQLKELAERYGGEKLRMSVEE